MSRREPLRRTPVISGDSEVTLVGGGLPKDPSAAVSSPAGLAHGPHVAHAYTRRQLSGQESLTPAGQAKLPEIVDDTPVEQAPGQARLPEPEAMGAIIGFQRSGDGGKTVYSYAAIKTPKGWYCTAVNFQPALTWVDLLAWIDAWPHEGDEQPAIWLAADWVEVQ